MSAGTNTTPSPRRAIARRLRDRVVIVTGSSRGIGRETARYLLQCGAVVVLNGRDAARLSETETSLRASLPGARLSACAADVSTEDGAAALVSHATTRWDHLDALVNNAGVSMRGAVADVRAALVERILAGNIHAVVFPTVAALPHLRARRGRVAFVSTEAAARGFPGVSLYSAAKGAVERFAEALDAEERSAGLTVRIIALGFVENDPDKHTLAPDGTSFRHRRRARHTQREAAEAICAALARGRGFTSATGAGRLLRLAVRLVPRPLGRLLAASGGRIHRAASSDT